MKPFYINVWTKWSNWNTKKVAKYCFWCHFNFIISIINMYIACVFTILKFSPYIKQSKSGSRSISVTTDQFIWQRISYYDSKSSSRSFVMTVVQFVWRHICSYGSRSVPMTADLFVEQLSCFYHNRSVSMKTYQFPWGKVDQLF